MHSGLLSTKSLTRDKVLSVEPFSENIISKSSSILLQISKILLHDSKRISSSLKIGTTTEKLFIERVVQLVDQKVLPLSMVLGVFQYARKKEDRYPFFYFREALKIRAAKELGVKL